MNVLEFAINMEKEGEAFYRSQAEKNKATGLNVVFAALAEDEKRHAEIITEFLNSENPLLPESSISGIPRIFKDLFTNEFKQFPGQIDAYRTALVKEKESIDLYKSLLDKANEIREIDVFGYLIEQEELHYTTIEDMIDHIEKADSWVESAEFGIREDY